MSSTETLGARVRDIGERVAGPVADEVDMNARFPAEAVDALRLSGALGALVPIDWGGPGASVSEMAQAVASLAEYCASSALILAMHAIQVACIVRHAQRSTLERVVPGLLAGELLLANANSELGLGGERRSSICALEATAEGFRLEKRASTVSYGEYADGVLATARRSADSPPNEQVFAVCLQPRMSLEPFGDWNTLGLRGTCSRPALLTAELSPDLVIDNYGEIFMRTSLATSGILLSAVWLGIAEAAASRAHASVREQARRQRSAAPGAQAPTSALRLAELGVVLHQLRSVCSAGAERYERVKDSDEVTTLAFSSKMDNLKIASSTLAGEIVRRALLICGLPGYQNDSPSSLGRLVRDSAAAPLMVNNDRTLGALAQALLIRKEL